MGNQAETLTIIPVIFCGGRGNRLWPLSRLDVPKQFLKLNSDLTLLQETAKRISGCPEFAAPVIVTNEENRFMIADQLAEIGITPEAIILEPIGRDTAAALALAALHVADTNPEAIIFAIPADHHIEELDVFLDGVFEGAMAAKEGYLGTFGIQARFANTAVGYLQMGEKISPNHQYANVTQFIEKPDATKAQTLIDQGNCYWNSGKFIFKAETMLNEFALHARDILQSCLEANAMKQWDGIFVRPNADSFKTCRAQSIDYAIMEKSTKVAMVPLNITWSDLGSWQAIWEIGTKDENNNSLQGNVAVLDSRNTYVRGEDGIFVATIGLDNMAVIATHDAVLVAPLNRSDDIKKIIADRQKNTTDNTSLMSAITHRPWGSYESLTNLPNYQVKRLKVTPNKRLSLQMHHHRSEHWIVVRGVATVQVNEEILELTAGQSVYIPLEAKHRLENKGTEVLEVIEVQTGYYLGEDDIVRFQDDFGRTEEPTLHTSKVREKIASAA